jgi:sulfonate transport system substrate-binding protein
LERSNRSLHKDDVVIVPLEHKEGRIAFERNEVDAWSTIHPYASLSQLENGSRVLYRNRRFNTYSSLVVTEDFARKYPDVVTRVIKVYERARKWAITHPDDLEKIYADEEKVSLQVARLALSKLYIVFTDQRPGTVAQKAPASSRLSIK